MGHSKMPLNLVKFYSAEIILALHALRAKNIVHRDVKPENILVTDDWHLKLVSLMTFKYFCFQIDFGDAMKIDESEAKTEEEQKELYQKRKATFVGTPLYVSPEMLQDNISSASGDVWALGCIMYQMLTGEVPFKAAHDFQTFQLILERKMVFPADMEPEAKNLIDRLLDLNYLSRFGSGPLDSANDLRAVLSHPFFSDVDVSKLQTSKVPIPPVLSNSFAKTGTVKKVVPPTGAEKP